MMSAGIYKGIPWPYVKGRALDCETLGIMEGAMAGALANATGHEQMHCNKH